MSVQQRFETLAEETSRSAARIECDREDYIEGLQTIIEHLMIDLGAAKEG